MFVYWYDVCRSEDPDPYFFADPDSFLGGEYGDFYIIDQIS